MAVRCKDLIRGRPYDVVGEIDVPGRMGHDDEAGSFLGSAVKLRNCYVDQRRD
jgi:hypothetical protein